MKKLIFVSILFALFFIGCVEETDDSGIVVIRENMFITQINEINLNYRNYLGRTIKLEGIFKHNFWEDNNWFYVIRNAPGCCGDDGQVGLEVSWNADYLNPEAEQRGYPNANEWVEVIGELKSYTFLGTNYIYLALSGINVLETRGAEFVTR